MSKQGYLLGGWVPFTVATVLSLSFSTCYILWFRSTRSQDRSKMSTSVAILALTITLMAGALVPVDVFLVSNMKNSNGSFKEWAEDPEVRKGIVDQIMTAYYVFYGIIMGFIFLILPMNFFYHAVGDYEDEDDERFYDQDQPEESTGRRLCRAFKYTLASLFLFGLLVLLGLFLPYNNDNPTWVQRSATSYPILDEIVEEQDTGRGENLILFLTNVLNVIGMFLLILYTAYGMSVLPCGMVIGSDTVHTERTAVNREIAEVEAQIQQLKEEFAGREDAMNDIDKTRLDRLERELRLLNRNRHNLEQSAKSFINRCVLVCRPFQLMFGAFFTLFGFMIFLSLLLTSIDKAINSMGPKSGYVLKNATLPNPVDTLLVYAQSVFPLDYIIYSGMILFFVFSSMSGIKNVGIRFMWLSVYKIRAGKTKPQAILLMCMNLMFILLALNVVMFSVVPDYTTYGSQRFIRDNVTEECNHLEAPETDCVMTRVAVLLLAFNYKIWLFGAAYYWLVWAFISSIVLGSVYALYKLRRSARSSRNSDNLDEALIDQDAIFGADD